MERTYIMIKPDGVQRGLIGEGYQLVAMKMDSPSREHLEQHYSDLSELPFFGSLVDYMLMGPVVCMVWSGDDVVGRNICHGSDSVDNAEKEIELWFPEGVGVCDWECHSSAWVYEGK